MPNRSCFFCGPTKNTIMLSEPLSKEAIPLQLVAEQCEIVFGIKASKLPNALIADAFTLFYATGFNNIYGITRIDFGAGDNEKLRVVHLEPLNDFLMAETIKDKKTLYLAHCKLFINRYLENMGVEAAHREALKPVLDFVAQQFHVASHKLLFDGLKQNPTKNKRALRIHHLKALSTNITELIFVAMEIHKIISSGPTKANLEKALSISDKFMTSNTGLEDLGYKMLSTKQDAIENTLSLWFEPHPKWVSTV